MLKLFSFFKARFQFDNDELIDAWIQCNNCNKIVTCKISEPVTIDILPVFVKVFALRCVGLSWMIETKEQYTLSAEACSAKNVVKIGVYWGSYRINIFVFLTLLRIFIPRLETLFYINCYFLVCIFQYLTSTCVNSGIWI